MYIISLILIITLWVLSSSCKWDTFWEMYPISQKVSHLNTRARTLHKSPCWWVVGSKTEPCLCSVSIEPQLCVVDLWLYPEKMVETITHGPPEMLLLSLRPQTAPKSYSAILFIDYHCRLQRTKTYFEKTTCISDTEALYIEKTI